MRRTLVVLALVALAGCDQTQITVSGGSQPISTLSRANSSPAPSSTIVYAADFEGGLVGAEWSDGLTAQAPKGETFLGEFGNQAVTLSIDLSDRPHAKVIVSAELYVLKSWNGVDDVNAPNVFDISSSGTSLLHTTFANGHGGRRQNYPDNVGGRLSAAERGSVRKIRLGYDLDAAYLLSYTIDHAGSEFSVTFQASGLTGNATWGLDNVIVSILP
jgi:hypothetical protein